MTETRTGKDVLAAVREYISRVPEDAKPARANELYWDVGKTMNVGLHEQETRQDDLNAERFSVQVRHALDTLASEGVLIKIGKGEQGLSGYRQNTPEYYTPAQYEHAVAKARQERSARLAATTRWEEIHDQLERRGVPLQSYGRGKPVVLDLDGWDTLLGQLAKGAGCRGSAGGGHRAGYP